MLAEASNEIILWLCLEFDLPHHVIALQVDIYSHSLLSSECQSGMAWQRGDLVSTFHLVWSSLGHWIWLHVSSL